MDSFNVSVDDMKQEDVDIEFHDLFLTASDAIMNAKSCVVDDVLLEIEEEHPNANHSYKDGLNGKNLPPDDTTELDKWWEDLNKPSKRVCIRGELMKLSSSNTDISCDQCISSNYLAQEKEETTTETGTCSVSTERNTTNINSASTQTDMLTSTCSTQTDMYEVTTERVFEVISSLEKRFGTCENTLQKILRYLSHSQKSTHQRSQQQQPIMPQFHTNNPVTLDKNPPLSCGINKPFIAVNNPFVKANIPPITPHVDPFAGNHIRSLKENTAFSLQLAAAYVQPAAVDFVEYVFQLIKSNFDPEILKVSSISGKRGFPRLDIQKIALIKRHALTIYNGNESLWNGSLCKLQSKLRNYRHRCT